MMKYIRILLKNIIPYGLAKIIKNYKNLISFGMPSVNAINTALNSMDKFYSTRLNLFPPNSYSELSIIVDIGANVGDWSLGILSLLRPDNLTVIEANPYLESVLRNRLNKYNFIEFYNVAIGNKTGTIDYHIASHSHSSSALLPKSEMNNYYGTGYESVEKIKIDADTLDNLLNEKTEISLLKIDVQGYEKYVLEGAPNILKKTKYLLIEIVFLSHYHGDILFPELHQLIINNGFSLLNISKIFKLKDKPLWADALYVNNNL